MADRIRVTSLMESARAERVGWCRFYQPLVALAIKRQAWKSAAVFSTDVTKLKCATCSGPTHRLQQLPHALSLPGQVQGYYTLFVAKRRSPSARERVPETPAGPWSFRRSRATLPSLRTTSAALRFLRVEAVFHKKSGLALSLGAVAAGVRDGEATRDRPHTSRP